MAVRLFAGIMSMAARVKGFKFRYLWRISHADGKNLAFSIYYQKMNELHKTKIGFTHEVFTLYRKLIFLDVWLKIRKPKGNPLTKIRRTVVSRYFRLGVLKCQSLPSIYTFIIWNHNHYCHNQRHFLTSSCHFQMSWEGDSLFLPY